MRCRLPLASSLGYGRVRTAERSDPIQGRGRLLTAHKRFIQGEISLDMVKDLYTI